MFSIRYIEIVLENCEVIKIDGKHIGFFLMNDIKKKASILGCNAFGVHETATETFLEISKDGNVKYNPFGIKDEERRVFDRLMEHNDITSIDIQTDDEQLRYFTNWTGDNDYVNEAQSSVIGKNGCLYIAISPDTTASEYFSEVITREEMEPWAHGFNNWMRDDWGENAEHAPKEETEDPEENCCKTCNLKFVCEYRDDSNKECLNCTGNVSVEDAMEIGNMLFGNSRGLFHVDRAWEDKFYEIFSAAGLDSYGYAPESVATERGGFKNDVFHIEPYYWGDDEALEDEPNFWFIPDGLEIQWYKYAFRDSYCNKKISYLEFCEIVDKCIESLEKKED